MTTYTNRSNATRAARKALDNGTAPAAAYTIAAQADGRFAIVWEAAWPAPAEAVPGDAERLADLDPPHADASVHADVPPPAEDAGPAVVAPVDADALLAEAAAAVLAKPRAVAGKEKPPGKREAARSKALTAARAGVLPAKLRLEGAYQRNAKHADRLYALAEAGDLAALKAYPLNGNYTSMNMLKRWRDLLVVAVAARLAAKAAAQPQPETV